MEGGLEWWENHESGWWCWGDRIIHKRCIYTKHMIYVHEMKWTRLIYIKTHQLPERAEVPEVLVQALHLHGGTIVGFDYYYSVGSPCQNIHLTPHKTKPNQTEQHDNAPPFPIHPPHPTHRDEAALLESVAAEATVLLGHRLEHALQVGHVVVLEVPDLLVGWFVLGVLVGMGVCV